jgi:ABC-2 type transport system permease protein
MATAAVTTQRKSSLRGWWTALRIGYWLGWQIESNWTDPLLFFIYSIARPLGGVLILVFMYYVVGRAGGPAMLGFFVVGTACWPFVVRGMMGMAYSLITDREHWKTLRYVYTAPIPFRAYLVGRALAQATSAVTAAAVTLLFGRWVLGVPMHIATMDLPYTIAACVLGIASVIALGLAVVSVAMSISGEAWRMPEGVGAALYLVCGAIFPVAVLPPSLRIVAQAIPLTWWLEATRRGLLGSATIRSFPEFTDSGVMTNLALLTTVWVAAAFAVFAFAERRARQRGVLDRESAY